MPTCLGKSYSFVGLLCESFVNVLQMYVCVSFPFSFDGGMRDLVVLIPDQCHSVYFVSVVLFLYIHGKQQWSCRNGRST